MMKDTWDKNTLEDVSAESSSDTDFCVQTHLILVSLLSDEDCTTSDFLSSSLFTFQVYFYNNILCRV